MDVEQLADLTRTYIDRLVTTKAPPEVLQRVAALVVEASGELEAHVPTEPRNMYEGFEGFGGRDAYLELFRLNPVIGRLNPVAPRFSLEIRDDGAGVRGTEVIARTTLGLLYEGPAGMVHGGIIASLFDQFLSIANIHNGFGAFTGTLTVRYREPCPLDTPLEFRCRTDRTEVRKVFAAGELLASETVVAEAAGVFIEPTADRRAELVEEGGFGPEATSTASVHDLPTP